MEIPVVTEAEQIEFERLALHHLGTRNIGDVEGGKVWLARNGTERSKLWAVELDEVVIALVLVWEGL